LRLPVRRELGALRPPPDGCRFDERIRDLERSLREERRGLREAYALYRRLAFRGFEQTLLTQPRVFPTQRKQLLVGSALDDTAVIKHCRRLTRLTNAFSKKLENFKAAVALHYAYYNLMKSNIAIRCTPAMAAGVTNTFWTVRDLVEMVEA